MNNNDKPKINPENINEKSNNEFGFKEAISFNDEKKINPKKNEKSKILWFINRYDIKEEKRKIEIKIQLSI